MMHTHDNNENDTFLSDWLSGSISDGQLKQLVSQADFEAYQKLKDSLHGYELAPPDMEKNFAGIKQKLEGKKNQNRPRVLPLYKYSAVAATLLLLVGLYQMFSFSNLIETDFGKTAAIHLKDDSQVTLNAKSTLSFPSLFKYNRTLKLDGEAYFEVKKGSTFTVETPQGNIRVLGTKFNVVSRPGYFEVVCFEGKVKVDSHSRSTILTLGETVRFYGDISETWKEIQPQQPLWVSGESNFRNAPLYHVIGELQNQYHHEVQYPESLKKIRYTGSFSNQNLDTALQSICLPLNLTYKKTASGKIIISE